MWLVPRTGARTVALMCGGSAWGAVVGLVAAAFVTQLIALAAVTDGGREPVEGLMIYAVLFPCFAAWIGLEVGAVLGLLVGLVSGGLLDLARWVRLPGRWPEVTSVVVTLAIPVAIVPTSVTLVLVALAAFPLTWAVAAEPAGRIA